MNQLFTCFLLLLFFSNEIKSQNFILNQNWKSTYHETNSSFGVPIGIDDINGVVYTALSTDSLQGKRQIVILKYNQQTGATIWTKVNYTPMNIAIQPGDMTVDANSNVYVVGNALNRDLATRQIYFVKYDSQGNRLLEVTYSNPSYLVTDGAKIKVDNKGNIYILGISVYNNSSRTQDMVFLKYDKTGKLLWSRNYDSNTNSTFWGLLELDQRTNSLYVSGNASGIGGSGTSQIVTLKYDLNGNQKWATLYSGLHNNFSSPTAMCLDPTGNLYVTGVSDFNFVTIKYRPTIGGIVWIQRYTGPYNQDIIQDIKADNNAVYITGTSYGGDATLDDIVTIKYNLNGGLMWLNRFDGAKHGRDQVGRLAVDKAGYVYVSGIEQQTGNVNTQDMITLLINPTGHQIWKSDFNGMGNGGESPNGIAIDNNGGVYITSSYGGGAITSIVKYTRISPFGGGIGGGSGGGGGGGSGTSGILTFASQDVFNIVMDSLSRTSDTRTITTTLEKKYSYTSLETIILNREDSLLDTGADLDETNDPDYYFIVDDDLRAVLNDKNEIIIGNTYYKFVNDSITITITNPDMTLIEAVRNNDPAALSNARVSSINSANGVSNATISSCTDFTFQQTDTSEIILSTNSYGASTNGVTYTWDYGDGETESIIDPNTNFPHVFPTQGTYEVCLTITGGSCDGANVCHTVNVGTETCNPVFSISKLDNLTATIVNLSYGSYSTLEWDFGDGTTASDQQPGQHIFPDSGTYTISLRLGGGECDTIVYSVDVHVNQPIPGDCNCDRRDHEKIKYNNYASKLKFKGKAWYSNFGIIGYHRVGSKTVNYKRSKIAGITRWRRTKIDEIEATFEGHVWQDSKDNVSQINFKCHLKKILGFNSESRSNKPHAKTVPAQPSRFGVSKDAIHYTFRVKYNGTNYTNEVYLSDDTRVKPCQ